MDEPVHPEGTFSGGLTVKMEKFIIAQLKQIMRIIHWQLRLCIAEQEPDM